MAVLGGKGLFSVRCRFWPVTTVVEFSVAIVGHLGHKLIAARLAGNDLAQLFVQLFGTLRCSGEVGELSLAAIRLELLLTTFAFDVL